MKGTPLACDDDFTLAVPDVDAAAKEASEELVVSLRQHDASASEAERRAEAIMSIDLADAASKGEARRAIERLGAGVMDVPSARSAVSVATLRGIAERANDGSELAHGLTDLACRMRRLDPSHVDFAHKGLLSHLFDPVERYCEQVRSARSEIEHVMVGLKRERDTLAADNIELERRRLNLIRDSRVLSEEIDLAVQLEKALVSSLERMQASGVDPAQAHFVRHEILVSLERRLQDMRTLLAINQQGIITMSVLRENNRMLIASIDNTSRASLRALDTVVMFQRVLHSQQQPSGEPLGPESIKESFEYVFSTLEAGDAFREAAVPKLQATINELQDVAQCDQDSIDRLTRSQPVAGHDSGRPSSELY